MANPLTTPVADIGATVELLLDQTPPGVASVNVDVAPRQMPSVPEMVPGEGGPADTVTGFVAATVPQAFVSE